MIRVGIIGAGNIAPSHVRAYQAFADRCTVVGVADGMPGRAAELVRAHGLDGARAVDTPEQLLAEGVDLVSVCTPPATHEELCIAVLEAGASVLCEKPIAPSLAACDAVEAAERRSRGFVSSVAQNRFRDDVVRTRAVLDSGLLGPVAHVQVDSAWWRGLAYYDLWWRGTWEREGGGPTLNHAVHHIDLLLWLMGAPTAVTAAFTNAAHDNAEVEDLSVAVLTYERALATITSSVVHHGQQQRFAIQGRSASIDLTGAVVAEVSGPTGFPAPGGDPELVARIREVVEATPPLAHTGHAGQVDDVLTALETGTAPSVTSADGRRTIELITAVYQAAIERRTVDLPLASEVPYYSSGALVERAPRFGLPSPDGPDGTAGTSGTRVGA